jgi:hypothetical protein
VREEGENMLPYDQKPWARILAKIVIFVSFLSLSALTLILYRMGQLHISEGVGIVLLLLLFLPPNIAILTRPDSPHDPSPLDHSHHHGRTANSSPH